MQKRKHLKETLRKIALKATEDEAQTEAILSERAKLTEFACYEELVKIFSDQCFNLPKVNHLIVLYRCCQRNNYLYRTNMPTGSCTFWSTCVNRACRKIA